MVEFPILYVEVENIYSQSFGAGYRSVAITSSVQGEGKSSVVDALAKRAKFSGKNVLVVDLNTFNPQLSEKLRQLSESDGNEIIALPKKGYSLLPAPQSIPEIMKFKESNILNTAINDWLDNYDCVIFDTSPLQSLNQSNIPPEIVCRVCEGAILIIEAGKTPANLIEEGAKKLKSNKVNVIGTVINDKHNPSLLYELIRETKRLDRLLPNAMTRLRKYLASLTLLNVSV